MYLYDTEFEEMLNELYSVFHGRLLDKITCEQATTWVRDWMKRRGINVDRYYPHLRVEANQEDYSINVIDTPPE
jgi:hypothetical protein